MKKIYVLLIFFFIIINNSGWGQGTIIGYNFEDQNVTADAGITANSTKTISTNATGTITYPAGSGVTGAYNISNTGWDNGSDLKYWEIEFVTNGFTSLTISSKQKSSDTGPKDFKLQYKVGAGGTYTDVSGTSIIVANDNFISGVLTNVSLPSGCNDQSSVYLIWIMTSNTSTNGGTVGGTGTSRIDDITIKGILNSHSGVNAIGTGSGTGTISWTQANGYSNSIHTTLVFVKASDPIIEGTPTNDPSSYASNTIFGSGSTYQNDVNAYCVFNGDGISVDISGIINGTNYYALVLNVADPNVYSSGTTGKGILPVELSSFSAIVHGNAVNLNWQTKTEVNNYGFEIERASSSTTPIQGWEKIGFVNGSGNSNSPKDYNFTDRSVTNGKFIYRLKQIDTDGKYEYSKEVAVDLGLPKNYALGQNYPNPFNPTTKINYTLPVESDVIVIIFTVDGELVKTLVNEKQSTGSYSIDFDARKFASGMYIYKLIANDFIQIKKMLLIK